MASTYTPIATTTLGSAQGTVTFSSIPSTYTDLVIIGNVGGTAIDDWFIRFNGDTATNYSDTYLQGNGTAAASARQTNNTNIRINSASAGYLTTSITTNGIINIFNYANTTTYKTALIRANLASAGVNANVGLWRSTAAINSVSLIAGTTTFLSGSTFTLYGITAA